MCAAFIFKGQTTDSYQFLAAPTSSKLRIQVSNAAVLIGFGHGLGAQAQYEAEDEYYLPVVGVIVKQFDALRFMSAASGTPAQLVLIPQ